MTLREHQAKFTRDIARLVDWTYAMGYELTFGEAWRPPEMVQIYAERGSGSENSLHPDRLAVDFNLFRDGVYLTKTEDHAPLGMHWKQLDTANRWGGDFMENPDGNHYSRSVGDGRA